MKQLDWYLESYINEPWAYFDRAFSDQECDEIIKKFKNNVDKARIQNKNLLTETRDSNVYFIDSGDQDNNWLFQRLATVITRMNEQFFNFNIEKIESVQFTEYDESYKGFYKSHVDTAFETSTFRKLSFSLQLTDSDEYSGGDLLLHTGYNPDTASRTKGTMNVFPSYLLHEVTPVTEGTRYALVGWVLGERFK